MTPPPRQTQEASEVHLTERDVQDVVDGPEESEASEQKQELGGGKKEKTCYHGLSTKLLFYSIQFYY